MRLDFPLKKRKTSSKKRCGREALPSDSITWQCCLDLNKLGYYTKDGNLEDNTSKLYLSGNKSNTANDTFSLIVTVLSGVHFPQGKR